MNPTIPDVFKHCIYVLTPIPAPIYTFSFTGIVPPLMLEIQLQKRKFNVFTVGEKSCVTIIFKAIASKFHELYMLSIHSMWCSSLTTVTSLQ